MTGDPAPVSFRATILLAGKSPIGDAKTPATRERRIAKAIEALREGRA
jgi:hypothetical protein